MCYYDTNEEEFYNYSPIDLEAINSYNMLKKQKEKKSTVVPKTKLLPIGENKSREKKTHKNSKNNLLNKDNTDSNKDMNKNREIKTNISNFLDNVKPKNDKKTHLNESSKKDSKNNVAKKFIEDIEGFDQFNDPSPKRKREDKNDAEKRNYYNDAIERLKNINKEFEREFNKKQENYEIQKKKFMELLEEQNFKLIEKKTILLEDEMKNEITSYENKLIEENLKIYKENEEISIKTSFDNKNKINLQFSEKIEKKNSLLQEISNLEKIIPQPENENNELNQYYYEQVKYLLEEKFDIEIKSMEKKSILEQREIEKTQEISYINEIKTLKIISIPKNNNMLFEKLEIILNEYKTALDKEYEISSRTIELEMEETLKKELSEINQKLEIEEKERNEKLKKEGIFIETFHLNRNISLLCKR